MPTVAEVLRRHGGEYLDRFGTRMPALHRQVLGAIRACRTGALGKVQYACTACGGSHVMGRSCGNRHCPTCQQEKARAWLLETVDPAVWKRDWVVHSKAVRDGRTSLKYLATYVFRVGISDHRIVACDNHKVTFSYRKSGTRRWQRMPLDAMEFIRRFLQHVLPRGLQNVRHYGFLGTHASLSIEAVRWLVALHNGAQFVLLAARPADVPLRPARRCAECGGQLRVVAVIPKRASAIHDTS